MNEISNWTSSGALVLKELLTELKRNKLMDAYSFCQIVILKGFVHWFYCLVLFSITITMTILLLSMVLIIMMMTSREWVLSLGAD